MDRIVTKGKGDNVASYLVLDANVLIRAVLGNKVKHFLLPIVFANCGVMMF